MKTQNRMHDMTKATSFLIALFPLAVTGGLVVVEQAAHGWMDHRLDSAMEHVGLVAAQLPEADRSERTESLVTAALADAGIPGAASVQVREQPSFEGPSLAVDVRIPWEGVLHLVPHPDVLQHQLIVGVPQ